MLWLELGCGGGVSAGEQCRWVSRAVLMRLVCVEMVEDASDDTWLGDFANDLEFAANSIPMKSSVSTGRGGKPLRGQRNLDSIVWYPS